MFTRMASNNIPCPGYHTKEEAPVREEQWVYMLMSHSVQFSSVQSLSCVQLFVTPWTAASQASLSITNSRTLLKLMSIKVVMQSNNLILCCTLLNLPSPKTTISKCGPQLAATASSGNLLKCKLLGLIPDLLNRSRGWGRQLLRMSLPGDSDACTSVRFCVCLGGWGVGVGGQQP